MGEEMRGLEEIQEKDKVRVCRNLQKEVTDWVNHAPSLFQCSSLLGGPAKRQEQ